MPAPKPVPDADSKKERDPRATEDQVDMKDTVPQRVNKKGTKIEDIAGTGSHDSQGG